MLGLAALTGLVFYRIYPGKLHEKTNPGFIDNIFGSNLVVFAARLVLLSAALVLAFVGVYTVVSVINWMRHRQWLAKAGPFEVSPQAIEGLESLVEFWQGEAVARAEEVEQLAQQLQQSNELLNMFLASEEGLESDTGTDNLSGDEPRGSSAG